MSPMDDLVSVLEKNQRDPSQPPHLSASSIALHMRCPRQWQLSYVLGEKGEKNDALVIGSGAHLALSRKLTGEPVGNWWEESLEGYVPEDSRSKEIAESMVYHYWETIGRHLTILSTEREILVDVPGVEIPVLGYLDIETPDLLIDLKTTRYFSRKGVRPNKEWKLAQGIYQLAVPKPSQVHVLTRAKTDPVVVPDSTSHPLHFGLLDAQKTQQTVLYEWNKMKDNWNRYGAERPWPGNPMHEWASKYCNVKNCCSL